MDFERAFEKLIGHEGGFQQDTRDKGNWTGGAIGKGVCKGTKFGVSAAAYPGEDIEHLTLERAKFLYLRDYWGAGGCDAVPDALKFDLFDMVVNSGKGNAIKTLQRAVGETPDGILGPLTLQAAQSMDPVRLVARFNGARLLFLADSSDWPAFGRGWARRAALNLMEV